MKPFALLIAAWLFTFVGTSHAEDKKDGAQIKVVVDHLDTSWGIKFKSVTAKDSESKTEIKITLDFTQDVTEPSKMREALGSLSPNGPMDPLVVFHLFDEDNVSMGKYFIKSIEGDLSGIKGDAFRIIIECDTVVFQKAKKIEARLPTPPKPNATKR